MRLLVLPVLLAFAGIGHAGSLLYRADLIPEQFPDAAERIRELMQPGQVHGPLSPTLKQLVLDRLDRIAQQLEQPHANSRRQQLALERHLKSVNDLLATGRTSPDSKIYCRRQQTTGSKVVQVICYDRDEVEEKAFETRNSFFAPVVCSSGCG
jgi:hypothetical protein